MKTLFNSPFFLETVTRHPAYVLGLAALFAGYPLTSVAQVTSPASAATPGPVVSSNSNNTRPVLSGIILAARDITRPTEAGNGKAPAPDDACLGREPSGRAPTVSLAPLATLEAAAQYRRGLLAAGPVAQEGDVDPALVAAVTPFIGRQIDDALTADISRAVIAHLNAQSRQLSDVYYPPQDLRDGTLVLVVAPAVLGKVVAQGQQHTRAQDLICHIRVAPGAPVDPQVVADDVAFLNRNPWRRTDAAFAPGAAPGQTDIVLTTTDERPLRLFVGADNSGNRVTGLARYRAGVSVGSPFGLFDHRFDYTYLQASDRNQFNGHLLNYSLPLSTRDTLSASATYFSTNADLTGGLFKSSGANAGLGLQWNRTLGADSPFSLGSFSELYAGAEYKRIGSALAFNQVQVSGTAPVVLQGYVGYNTGWNDWLGRIESGVRLTLSPGGLSGHNKDADFNAVRPGAKSSYARLNFNYDRFMGLPDSWKLQGWQLHGRLVGQVASDALISSERFGVSGSQGVRGYYEDSLFGDSGLIVNLELQTSYYPVHIGGKQALLQGLVFVDAGRAYNKTAEVVPDLSTTASKNHRLLSNGVGLRFNLNPTLTLQASVGWRRTGINAKGSALGHISATLAF